MEKMINKEL